MANKIIFAFAFVLLLLCSCGIVTFTEGRPLKTVMGKNHGKYLQHVVSKESATDESGTAAAGHEDRISHNVTADADDFRPTTPGHSPGAGHSAGLTSTGVVRVIN
ncbi:hypothetical protein SLE2022_100830 [Rubroshorea leprosula]